MRRRSLQSAAVEHGQRGQRGRNAAASSHVPQLIGVVVNGVVVVKLDPGTHEHITYSLMYVGN